MEFVNGLLVYAHLGAGVATVWIFPPCACAVDAFLAWQIGRPCCLFSFCLVVEPNGSKRTSTSVNAGFLYILTFVSDIC